MKYYSIVLTILLANTYIKPTDKILDHIAPANNVPALKLQSFKTDQGIVKRSFLKLLQEIFNIKTFLEMETCQGYLAFEAHHVFKYVYTIGHHRDLLHDSEEFLKQLENIKTIQADDNETVPPYLSGLKAPILILLNTYCQASNNDETNIQKTLSDLALLKNSNLTNAIIVIDNLRTIPPNNSRYSLANLISTIIAINPHYYVVIFGDLLLAYPSSYTIQVSPLLHACTFSRLYYENPALNLPIFDIEKPITEASGEEYETLTWLYLAYGNTEKTHDKNYGTYTLWYALAATSRHMQNEQLIKDIAHLSNHKRAECYIKASTIESVMPTNFELLMQDNNKPFDTVFAQTDPNWMLAKKLYQKFIELFSITNTTKRIPFVFHLIWLGSKLPDRYIQLEKQLKKLHPQCMVKIWTDKQAKIYPMINRKSYDLSKNYGEKSDIWRYEILYNEGGIYIDGDFVLLKSLTPFTSNCDFFTGMSQDKNFSLANGLIGTIKHHPIMLECIEKIKINDNLITSNNFNEEQKKIFNYTGPYFFTHCFIEKAQKGNFINAALPPSFFYPWPHYEMWEKDQEVINRMIQPYTYGVHQWACSWQPWSQNYIPYHENL